jgi:hypothetical protein
MSINPVPIITPANTAELADGNLQKRASVPQEQSPVQPIPGTSSNQESGSVKASVASTELPQDEVQVLRDSQTNGEVVIKYLDHSGNLIVQIPSSQVLGVTRAIEQDFQVREKAQQSENKNTRTPEKQRGKSSWGLA